MQNAGPQHWRDDAAKKDRMPRQHRQHGAVKKTDQQRAYGMNDDGGDESTQAEVGDLRQGGIGPAGYAGSSQQIYRVPDAVIADQAIEGAGTIIATPPAMPPLTPAITEGV